MAFDHDPTKPPSAYFGGVRAGKSYVSYHLMPVEELAALTRRGVEAYRAKGLI